MFTVKLYFVKKILPSGKIPKELVPGFRGHDLALNWASSDGGVICAPEAPGFGFREKGSLIGGEIIFE